MGKDTNKALELVRISKDIQKPLVEKYKGKWLKEMGDGAMAQFGAALDAVNCAIEIQEQARAKYDGKLRIGIHLGDITIENDDVFGNGVNVASRLESIADPGGIYISESVQRAIRGENIQVKELGAFKLKNVDVEVRVYSIQGVGLPEPANQQKSSIGKTKTRSLVLMGIAIALILGLGYYFIDWNKIINPSSGNNATQVETTDKSIAVLAFKDLSPGKDQEYFSDGISEELINSLARIRELKVSGRTSSFSFKGTDTPLKEIGKDLRVNTILDGSVRKSGSKIRVSAQLVNATTGFNLWSSTYDKEFSDIFKIQDDIAKAIVDALSIRLLENENTFSTPSTTNMKAYAAYLQARRKLINRGDFVLEARRLFEESIALDSKFSPAYSGLSKTLAISPVYYPQGDNNKLISSAKEAAEKALSLDPNNAEAYFTLGYLEALYYWDFDLAERYYTKSIQLAPGDAEVQNFVGDYYLITLNKRLCLEHEKKALEWDPLTQPNYSNLSRAYYIFGDYEDALQISQLAISNGFSTIGNYVEMARIYIAMDNLEAAKALDDSIANLPLTNGNMIWYQGKLLQYHILIAIASGERERAIKLINTLSQFDPATIAEFYLDLKMWHKAARWIEKAYQQKDPILVYWSLITIPEDYPDVRALRKAFDKPELNVLFEIRRKNMSSIN